jgi:peptide/nickel transport system permease protein
MAGYALKRALLIVPTLVLVSLVVFAILRVIPGDPALLILSSGGEGGSNSRATADQLAALRHKLGTDRPLAVQYASWIEGILTLNAGESFITGRSVLNEIAERVPVSAELAAMTAIVSAGVALPLGIIAATHLDTRTDYLVRFVAKAGLSLPIFWTGTLVILGLSAFFRWTPPLSYAPLWEQPWENLQQMVWPALVMGFYQMAILASMMRASMLSVLPEPYVQTARAKGVHEHTVVTRHVVKNALLPVITIAGLQFGSLLGGIVILEQIFAVPGVGRLLVDAILQRDYPVVQTTVVMFAGLLVLINLAVDLSYAWLDPRIRHG